MDSKLKLKLPRPPKANASYETKLRYLDKVNQAKKNAELKAKEERESKILDEKITNLLNELRRMYKIVFQKKTSKKNKFLALGY